MSAPPPPPPPPPPPGFPPPPGGYGPGGYGPGGYGPGGYGAGGYGAARQTNGLAIASLVLGILSVISCGYSFFIAPVLAVVLAVVARRQIRERGQSGDGMAIAGLVMGIIGIVFSAIMLALLAVAIATDPVPTTF